MQSCRVSSEGQNQPPCTYKTEILQQVSQAHVEIVLVDMINLILMLHIFTFLGKTTVDFGSDYQIMGHGMDMPMPWHGSWH